MAERRQGSGQWQAGTVCQCLSGLVARFVGGPNEGNLRVPKKNEGYQKPRDTNNNEERRRKKKEARWKEGRREGGKEGKVDGRAWQEDIFLAVESDDGRRREEEPNAKDANKEGWRLPPS